MVRTNLDSNNIWSAHNIFTCINIFLVYHFEPLYKNYNLLPKDIFKNNSIVNNKYCL